MSKRKRGEDSVSYIGTSDGAQIPGDKTPPGPYSYTAERKQAIYNQRTRRENNHNNRPQLNEHFGQKSAFPDTELGTDEEEDDAMAYIRSVR